MFNLILKKYSTYLYKKENAKNKILSQKKILFNIIKEAKSTKFYSDHNLSNINSIKEYQDKVKLRTYEDFYEEYFKLKFPNLVNLTYKNKIKYFAESSGTTKGTTKYIPISKAMHKSNIKASIIALGSAFNNNINLSINTKNFLYLGSSTNLNILDTKVYAGDLSGIAAHLAPFYLKHFSYPNKKLANLYPWQTKIDAIIKDSLNKDIKGISGTPPWVLLFFEKLLQTANKEYLYQIWPNFNLFIYGGVAINNYLSLFNKIFYKLKPVYLELYPSSEGFIGYYDFNSNLLKLIIDNGIFYEFIPLKLLNDKNPIRHTVFDIEENIEYAIVITNNSGLWSYILGDTVKFICKNSLLFKITGRTKYYLSSFGEHISFEEIELVLNTVSKNFNFNILEFHIGAIFDDYNFNNRKHTYIIETDSLINLNKDLIINTIDSLLQKTNKDYFSYRHDNKILAPELIIVEKGFFTNWLKTVGKEGGQHKVAKVDSSGKILKSIISFLRN